VVALAAKSGLPCPDCSAYVIHSVGHHAGAGQLGVQCDCRIG
jgi:hypothetical protein